MSDNTVPQTQETEVRPLSMRGLIILIGCLAILVVFSYLQGCEDDLSYGPTPGTEHYFEMSDDRLNRHLQNNPHELCHPVLVQAFLKNPQGFASEFDMSPDDIRKTCGLGG